VNSLDDADAGGHGDVVVGDCEHSVSGAEPPRAGVGWVVRRATVADAGAIGALHVRAWRHSYRGIVPDHMLADLDSAHSAGRWREHLRLRRWSVFLALAQRGGRPALGAFCAVGPVDEPIGDRRGGRTGELYALYADPRALGRGAGPAAHGAGVTHLGAGGFHHLVLWVLTKNPRARAFYAKQGWRCDELTAREWHHGLPLPVVRYSRSVPADPR